MVSDARKKSMAWMETDYSKNTYFRWKVKWRLERLGALGTMGETAPLTSVCARVRVRVCVYVCACVRARVCVCSA